MTKTRIFNKKFSYWNSHNKFVWVSLAMHYCTTAKCYYRLIKFISNLLEYINSTTDFIVRINKFRSIKWSKSVLNMRIHLLHQTNGHLCIALHQDNIIPSFWTVLTEQRILFFKHKIIWFLAHLPWHYNQLNNLKCKVF